MAARKYGLDKVAPEAQEEQVAPEGQQVPPKDGTTRNSNFSKDVARMKDLTRSEAGHAQFFKNAPMEKFRHNKDLALRVCLCCDLCDKSPTVDVEGSFQVLKQDLPPGVDLLSCGEAAESAARDRESTCCGKVLGRAAIYCCICTLGGSCCCVYYKVRNRKATHTAWSNRYPIIALELRRLAAEGGLEQVSLRTFIPARPSPEVAKTSLRETVKGLVEGEKIAVAALSGEEKIQRQQEIQQALRALVQPRSQQRLQCSRKWHDPWGGRVDLDYWLQNSLPLVRQVVFVFPLLLVSLPRLRAAGMD